MKVYYVSWNDPETVFHEILWKENFTMYPSLYNLKNTETVSRRCSVKKMFLSQVCNSITKDTLALLFSYEFWESFENTFSYRKPPVAASESNNFSLKLFSCKVFQGSLHKLFHKSTAIVKMIIKSINIYHKSPVFVKVSRLCYNT